MVIEALATEIRLAEIELDQKRAQLEEMRRAQQEELRLQERIAAARIKGSVEWFEANVKALHDQLDGEEFRVGTSRQPWWGSFAVQNQYVHCSYDTNTWRVGLRPTCNDVEYIHAVGNHADLREAYRFALNSFIDQWQKAGRKMQRLVAEEVAAAQKALKALDAA